MIAAAAQADRLVAMHAPVMLRDAEALTCTITRPDYPEGIAVLEPAGRTDEAYCIGSGHLLAAALGCRRRPAALIVGGEARLRDALAYHGTSAAEAALQAARIDIELTAVHEAAHAVTQPLDRPQTDAGLAAVRRAYATPPEPESDRWRVEKHPPGWAAAFAVLVGRAIRFRPRDVAGWQRAARAAFASYGFDFDRVAEVTAGVGADFGLRDLLADAGLLARIAAVLPGDAERLVLVTEHRARPGVPAGHVNEGENHDRRDETAGAAAARLRRAD